jgi:hypothetical protein
MAAKIKIKRGGGTPSGLTFGEPAFDTTNSKLFVGVTSSQIWVGAEIDNDTALAANSQIKLPTQYAVKSYIDNNIAGGAVSSLNGITGAISIYGGSGISIASAGKGITLTNTGVVSAVAGTGISVSAATGAVTFTNNGVQSAVAGNQITVSGATGAVTIAVTATPSFTSITTTNNGTIGGDLVVTGNLTINGTTTTVNSNTMTIDDPLIVLGTSGGLPISASDAGKDRGIVFNYYDTAGRTGFFGWDASATEFVFQKSSTVTNEVVTGVSYGNLHVASLVLQNGAVTDTVIGSAAGAQTHTFRDYGGTIVTVNAEPTTGYILKGNSLGAHTWQDPNAAGFTAYAAGRHTARNIALTGDVTGTVSFDATSDVSITTTIAANSVALGTDTTGNYAADVTVAGIGLTITGAAGEGTSYVVTSGATSANTASQIVARDASGNFTAGTITASLTGNVSGSAGSAAILTTTRSIGLTGDISGSANFNGSADITISATIAANSVALGTDTTGNYVATLTTSSTGLSLANSGTENAAMTVDFSTITTGLNMGTFTFATNDFINTSGTVSLSIVDGGVY